ncbi:AGAP004529-PA-like protein [Anopheles sinensis]|uniref:AGAP004529-PA-like protein n=1 Tax=Anopheles sinensis TaxID=74873 RepID=A0A084WTX6_ANOSI|nr:AGAP004529-PA-like protein [Anopheles sinensis]
MRWERPTSVQYPNVWWTFEAPSPDRDDGRSQQNPDEKRRLASSLSGRNVCTDCTVACYKEDSKKLVAANLLSVKQVNSKEDGSTMRYGVENYLAVYGLKVNSRYRSRGIATQILKTRVPFCKTFGMRLTSNSFSPIASEVSAAKAGFKTNPEMR